MSKHIDPARDQAALDAEYFQTDPWAIDAILRRELLSRVVVDPCTGDGRMAMAAVRHGAKRVIALDAYDWGFKSESSRLDVFNRLNWFSIGSWPESLNRPVRTTPHDVTIFMNPPFSVACAFVDQARAFNVRKIICFQRQAWTESDGRRDWWARNPPNRIYNCGDRAYCWLGTIPMHLRKGGSYQPHSWFVWEQGHPAGTLVSTIYKEDQ